MGLQVSQGAPIERAGYMYLTSIQRAKKHEPFCIDATFSPLILPIASSTLGMAVQNYTGLVCVVRLSRQSRRGSCTVSRYLHYMEQCPAAKWYHRIPHDPCPRPGFGRPSSQIISTSKGHDACLPCLAARNNSTGPVVSDPSSRRASLAVKGPPDAGRG